MKRLWAVGVGGTALLSGWMIAGLAYARDDGEKDVRRPGRQLEMRMFGGGRLGLSLADVGPGDLARLGLSAERGAVVTDVHLGSAAEKAGIKDGDVVLRYGGQDVWSAAQLSRQVRETPAGRTVEIEVSRGGSLQKLAVVLAEPDRDRPIGFGPGGMGEDFHFEMPVLPELADMPTPPRPPLPPAFQRRFGPGQGRKLGLSYQELGDQLARYFKVEGGVLVTDVQEDGPAAKAGIRAGDVIVRIGGKAVKDGGDLREAIRDAAASSNATIGVQREGRSMDVTVRF